MDSQLLNEYRNNHTLRRDLDRCRRENKQGNQTLGNVGFCRFEGSKEALSCEIARKKIQRSKIFRGKQIDLVRKMKLSVLVNMLKSLLENTVQQAAQILAELKHDSKPTASFEQLEFSFGMVREFEVNKSVQRKLAKR